MFGTILFLLDILTKIQGKGKSVAVTSICFSQRVISLCSHVSKEPAGRKILDLIGLKPLITAELALGEGTGGILLLPLLDGALSVYNSAHSFDDLQIERYVEL